LTWYDIGILVNVGKVSHEFAKDKAEKEYEIYHQKQIELN